MADAKTNNNNNNRNNNKIFLLIHTMTITECDYVVQAQFFHAYCDRLNDARLVGRRLSMRIHPNLRRNRTKDRLRMAGTDLGTLMKSNSAKIRHHLRTVHIVPPDANLAPNRIVPKIDNAIAQQASIPSPLEMDICVPEKKVEFEKINEQLTPSSSTDQTIAWLTRNRFEKYLQTFCSFCGTDMLRMSREDLIQICGHADGIRLYNSLHMESIAPKLKIYVCREKSSVFNAVFLTSYNNVELVQKLSAIYGLAPDQIKDIYIEGPKAIHIHLSNDVLSHLEEETMFMLEVIQESDSCILLLKRIRQ